MVQVTRHAAERSKERHSLKKESTQRLARKALGWGVTLGNAQHKKIRQYLQHVFEAQNQKASQVALYAGRVWIFGNEAMLLTVYDLPTVLTGYLLKEQARIRGEKPKRQPRPFRTVDDEADSE